MNASNMVAAAMVEKENELEQFKVKLQELKDKLTERDSDVEKLTHQIAYKDQEIQMYKAQSEELLE